MSIKRITAENAPAAAGPYSHANIAGGFVFTSGTLGRRPVDGSVPADFREEVSVALLNLVTVLEAAGARPADVVRTMCLLTDAADAAVFNEEYARVFSAAKPSRSTFVVSLPAGVRVEIEATAYLG